jgi:hypothetical protein
MTATRLALLVMLALGGAPGWGQASRREPHIGYVYPAGGKRGTTFHLTVGGQFLRGAADVYVSGGGVQASVIRHYPPLRNISKEQRDALQQKMRGLFQERWSELVEDGRVSEASAWRRLIGAADRPRRSKDGKDPSAAAAELPEHPLFHGLEDKTLRELLHIRQALQQLRKGQRNAQIAETVLIEVTIDRDAAHGDRELRLGTRQGLTNPMVFQVGVLREARELELGDARLAELLPAEPPLELPILLNGQIMPGDIDRFRFRAQQGQQLVIQTHARQLIPYLADAVPGWFQATLTLYDDAGSELAFVDDYRFSPDPVLCYEVPRAGEYELEIRDSIYRGREDFVYRISLGERPFVTAVFPLGCRVGQKRYVAADGWNLSSERLFLDGRSDDRPGTRQKPLGRGLGASNAVTYEVSALRACREAEANDGAAEAQRVRLPVIVDGRIGRPGDVDVFRFKGTGGDEVVVEVTARRLRSPLDSLIRLVDAEGNILAWNDDCEHKDGHLHTDMGVLTHHADSFLRARLPEDGFYDVQVADAQGHGGESYAYRLRIGPPQPGFELRATPASINVRAGFAAPLCVYALRKDGFAGEIELVLKDAPRGFALAGARIPAGRDRVRATLSAPPRQFDRPVALVLEGRALIDGQIVTRTVVPAEDLMQAFLYRHLTPAQEFLAAVLGGRRFGRPLQPADQTPVQIPAGGVARVRIAAPPFPPNRQLELELSQPPPGISLRTVTRDPEGLALELAADGDAAPVGLEDNLIVAAFVNVQREPQEGRAAQQRQRIALGVLPAVPFEVVPK